MERKAKVRILQILRVNKRVISELNKLYMHNRSKPGGNLSPPVLAKNKCNAVFRLVPLRRRG